VYGNVTGNSATFVTESKYEDLPQDAAERLKLILLDDH